MSYDGNINFAEEEPMAVVDLIPCTTCSRTFNEKALSKHAPICRKASENAARRGQFNSSKQREGSNNNGTGKRFGSKQSTPKKAKEPEKKKKPAWKTKHEQFIRNIRAARQAQKIVNEGGDLSQLPPPPPDENPDYVKCQFCNRRFNETAAKRHIPFCETQHKRNMMKKGTPNATKAEKMNRRKQYKPPSLKRKDKQPRNISTSSGREVYAQQLCLAYICLYGVVLLRKIGCFMFCCEGPQHQVRVVPVPLHQRRKA
eukprot:m.18747 g.18747  ORF g.18747 m.18747 type:complete len:257 (+) comp8356_c0_seq1:197-967(+)